MLRMAQKLDRRRGRRAAALLKTQRNRIKHFDEAAKQMVGDLTKAEYYVIRNDTWREPFDNQVIGQPGCGGEALPTMRWRWRADQADLDG